MIDRIGVNTKQLDSETTALARKHRILLLTECLCSVELGPTVTTRVIVVVTPPNLNPNNGEAGMSGGERESKDYYF